VDNVQELVKSNPRAEPERYIRPKQERIGCSTLNAPASLQIPVIDMGRIVSGCHSTRQHEMARLSKACQEWGFFQGYGHGFIFSDDQKLDWCDMMALATMPKSIRKQNVWQDRPLLF
ncbi:hypothetical protein KI387_014488, partial [Taxus chinensis]